MSKEAENIWDRADEWSGITSAQERRRRQNRIHQRAHRQKKRQAKFPKDGCSLRPDGSQSDQRPLQYQIRHAPDILSSLPMLLLTSRHAGIHEKVKLFLEQVYGNWSQCLVSPPDLPLVTRMTTFDALARNALVLQIPFEYLETDDHSSLFNVYFPQNRAGGELQFPTDLAPTSLQRTVTHHSWLDLFPLPKMRDNIFRGIENGEYDEDELCQALCCDLLDFDTGTNAALVVWGDSWDAAGW